MRTNCGQCYCSVFIEGKYPLLSLFAWKKADHLVAILGALMPLQCS
jgi:hypothetical protein